MDMTKKEHPRKLSHWRLYQSIGGLTERDQSEAVHIIAASEGSEVWTVWIDGERNCRARDRVTPESKERLNKC